MARPPQPGYVELSSNDPPVNLSVRLYDRPNVTQGFGGWAEVARPRRSTLTTWTGAPALRMDLPVLLDQFRVGSSIERRLAQLERLATATASDGNPPRVRVRTTGAAVPYQGRVWVVDQLTWGDALMNHAGNRVRQQVTLGLLEYIADVRIAELPPAMKQRATKNAAKTKAGAASKRITVGPGAIAVTGPHARAAPAGTLPPATDLLTIAARELGDADRWVEIAALNGIRDPRSLQPGQVIRLP
jgi:LysM domain